MQFLARYTPKLKRRPCSLLSKISHKAINQSFSDENTLTFVATQLITAYRLSFRTTVSMEHLPEECVAIMIPSCLTHSLVKIPMNLRFDLTACLSISVGLGNATSYSYRKFCKQRPSVHLFTSQKALLDCHLCRCNYALSSHCSGW